MEPLAGLGWGGAFSGAALCRGIGIQRIDTAKTTEFTLYTIIKTMEIAGGLTQAVSGDLIKLRSLR